MASERIQRQIDRLLDQVEEAISQRKWPVARDNAQDVLALDPENSDARAYLAAAKRALSSSDGPVASEGAPGPDQVPAETTPPVSPRLSTETPPASFVSQWSSDEGEEGVGASENFNPCSGG